MTPRQNIQQTNNLRPEHNTLRGKKMTPPEENYQNKNNFSLARILSTINNAISDINKISATHAAVKLENKAYKNAFHAEQVIIKASIELAESQIEADHFISQSDEHKTSYLLAFNQLNDTLKKRTSSEASSKTQKSDAVFSIPPIPATKPHPDPLINEAINIARKNLISERDDFFRNIRSQLDRNQQLKELVKNNLNNFGCGECWKYIS